MRTTAGHTCACVGILFSLVMLVHGWRWIPTGNPLSDETLRPRSDFMTFYGAAVLLLNSPEELYEPESEAAAQKAATGLNISAGDVDFLPFPYPAIVALAFVPFTLLKFKTAYMLMMAINLALLGMSIWLLSARLNLDDDANQVLVLCATASLAVYSALIQGQVSMISLLITVLAITNARLEKDRAGIWVGLLAFKPTVLPIWLFWFAIRRRWRALAYAVAVSGTIALVSFLITGFDGTAGFLRMSQRMAAGNFLTAVRTDMPTLRALVDFLGLGTAVWLGGLAAIIFTVWWTQSATVWGYCNLIIATILVAPHIQPQELVLVLIIVALLLAEPGISVSRSRVWLIFGFILWQSLARAVFAGAQGNHWPVMPLTFLGVFAHFAYKSTKASRTEWRHHPRTASSTDWNSGQTQSP